MDVIIVLVGLFRRMARFAYVMFGIARRATAANKTLQAKLARQWYLNPNGAAEMALVKAYLDNNPVSGNLFGAWTNVAQGLICAQCLFLFIEMLKT